MSATGWCFSMRDKVFLIFPPRGKISFQLETACKLALLLAYSQTHFCPFHSRHCIQGTTLQLTRLLVSFQKGFPIWELSQKSSQERSCPLYSKNQLRLRLEWVHLALLPGMPFPLKLPNSADLSSSLEPSPSQGRTFLKPSLGSASFLPDTDQLEDKIYIGRCHIYVTQDWHPGNIKRN